MTSRSSFADSPKSLEYHLKQQQKNTWPCAKIPHWDDLPKRVFFDFPVVIKNRSSLFPRAIPNYRVREIGSLLNTHNIILLEAAQGRGKTICSLSLGCELSRTAKFNPVVYWRAEELNFDQLERFARQQKEHGLNPLVIIEDLHQIEDAGTIVELLDDWACKCIAVSRPSDWSEPLAEFVPIVALRPSTTEAIEIYKTYIRQLAEQGRLPGDPRSFIAVADQVVSSIYSRPKVPLNLRRLGYFFRIWQPGTDPVEASTQLDSKFLRQVGYSPLISKIEQRSILLPLCAICRLEIFPKESFLVQLGDTENRNELLKEVVQKVSSPKGSRCVVDPSDAEDYLAAARMAGHLEADANSFTKAQLWPYLKAEPGDTSLCLQAIARNEKGLLAPTMSTMWPQVIQNISFHALLSIVVKSNSSTVRKLLRDSMSESSNPLVDQITKLTEASKREGTPRPFKLLALIELLSAMRKAELHRERKLLIESLQWSTICASQKGIHPIHLHFLVREMRDYPSYIEAFFRKPEFVDQFLRSSIKGMSTILTDAKNLGMPELAKNLLAQAGSRRIAWKIRTETASAFGLVLLMRHLRDVPNFSRLPIFEALESVRGKYDLGELAKMIMPLRPSQERIQEHTAWLSLLPTESPIAKFAESCDARMLKNALNLPLGRRLRLLEIVRLQDVVSRSDLAATTSLVTSLRKTAARIFARVPDAQEREFEGARLMQDYADTVMECIISSDWNRWPTYRLRVYSSLIQNASSLDGIYAYRSGTDRPAWESVAPSAKQVMGRTANLDICRAMRLEMDLHQQYGKSEAALREWIRFIRAAYLADSKSPLLKNPAVHNLIREEIANRANGPHVRMALTGLLCIIGASASCTLERTDVDTTLSDVELMIEEGKPNAKIISPFMLLLVLQGLMLSSSKDKESSRRLRAIASKSAALLDRLRNRDEISHRESFYARLKEEQ